MGIEHVIELQAVNKTFAMGFFRKRVEAVRDLSLNVRRGEVFGLVGPNGAGKTTTIKMITSLISPSSGTVRVFGKSANDVEGRRRLGYLPEISHYYHYLNASEILDFYAQLYQLDKKTRRKRVPELLERVGLGGAGKKRLGQFSKGMQQRLGLAQALIADPELVILDEPQSGLDPFGRKDVADIIAECRNEGKTVFFSSHILPDVERICDRVALLREGKLVRLGELDELLDSKKSCHVQFTGELHADVEARLKELGTELIREESPAQHRVAFSPDKVQSNDLLQYLIQNNLKVIDLGFERENLESLFVRLSKD
ncbi:MAG: ABC transporter ATP-binding protein [Bradymonadia bacterium]|jgi:ABC-2 type transport system ATP-binding protein